MLEKFSHVFKSNVKTNEENKEFYKDLPTELFELFDKFEGCSFNKGIYRIHSFKSSSMWALIISDYFKRYQHKIYPFGFDWMGRQYCLSSSNNRLIYMFDPSTGEDFTLQQTISLFHDNDLVNDYDDMLCSSMFDQILEFKKLKEIYYRECFGYKIPLFLGGKDDIDNYEKSDIEVYWHIQNQLYNKSKNLPDNTIIGSIKLE